MIQQPKPYSLLILMFLFLGRIKAQDFDYTLNKNSEVYSELSGAKEVCTNSGCTDKMNKIILPFSFNFCGKETDTITIEPNGQINFDNNKILAIVGFSEFEFKVKNTSSKLSYSTQGKSGDRIIKIEFKNLAKKVYSETDYLNYQIWLYENGNHIEYRIGDNYPSTVKVSIPDTNSYQRPYYKLNKDSIKGHNDFIYRKPRSSTMLGILHIDRNIENKGYFITGMPDNPQGKKINKTTQIPLLYDFPLTGTVYRLTPSFK